MEGLTCTICLSLLSDPGTLPCGHSFCRYPCLEQWLTRHPTCPIDRSDALLGLPPANIALADAIRALQDPRPIPAISARGLRILRQQVLGRGGSGAVYAGVWENLPVAVKVLRDDQGEQNHEVLTREARMLGGVRHPNILNFFGVCELATREIAIVTEKADTDVARFAASLLSSGASAADRAAFALHIGMGVARALHYLHTSLPESRLVVHHDVKPGNVLLVYPGRSNQEHPTLVAGSPIQLSTPAEAGVAVRLADFGVSRLYSPNAETINTTPAGALRGTTDFMAPERLSGGAAAHLRTSCDVFSLGMLLLSVFSGKHPWAHLAAVGDNWVLEVMRRVSSGERPPIPDDCPAMLASLVRACWEQEPSQRPTANDVLVQLLGMASPPSAVDPDDLARALEALQLDTNPNPTRVVEFLQEWLPADHSDDANVINDRERAIAGILRAMRTYPNCVHLQRQAIRALKKLAFLSEANKVAMVQERVFVEIQAAMRTHADNAALQEHACGALADLAVNDANRIAMGQQRVFVEIQAAMRTHTGNAEVQRQACSALWSLAADPANQVAMGQQRVFVEIQAAMRTHTDNADVQRTACGALASLAVNDGNAIAMGQQWVFVEIQAAMRTHTDNAEVQRLACRALGSLAADPANTVAIGQQRVFVEIQAAMRKHTGNAEVQRPACGTLARLAELECNRTAMGRQAAEAVFASLRAHPQDDVIRSLTWSALKKLARISLPAEPVQAAMIGLPPAEAHRIIIWLLSAPETA